MTIETVQVGNAMSHLHVVFEQSRSTKGVAESRIGVPQSLRWEDLESLEEHFLVMTLRELRRSTEEAHGFDVMPYPNSLYYFDPWPPSRGAQFPWIYRTKLCFGDGITNLRDHAAFMIRMAQARGVKIRIPIDNPAPRVGMTTFIKEELYGQRNPTTR